MTVRKPLEHPTVKIARRTHGPWGVFRANSETRRSSIILCMPSYDMRCTEERAVKVLLHELEHWAQEIYLGERERKLYCSCRVKHDKKLVERLAAESSGIM